MDFHQSLISLFWLSFICLIFAGISQYIDNDTSNNNKTTTKKSNSNKKVVNESTPNALQPLHYLYLLTYALIRLADWLQGTNMYTLYSSYGVDVGSLFMTGFVTSAICSIFIGNLVDKYGRKFGCLVYCGLEIIIQITEHFPDFRILFCGRILGGISTCLLFSSFESWLVAEHRSKNYTEESLSKTFSYASTLNGITAAMAGLIAKVAHYYMGEIGPFDVSQAITILCTGLIWYSWSENYGSAHEELDPKNKKIKKHNTSALHAALQPSVMIFGTVHALFEGAMYTFVFMWVPTLLNLTASETSERPPTEIIFSCLMVCISIGGILFNIVTKLDRMRHEPIGVGITFFAFLCMYVCHRALDSGESDKTIFLVVYINFCIFETLIGMFEPWMSTMRSKYVPNEMQATLMNWFRIPLNVLVGCGVFATDNFPLSTVYLMCAGTHLISCIALLWFIPKSAPVNSKVKNN